MKPKILTIQFRKNSNSIAQEQAGILREIGPHVQVDFISALDDGTNWGTPSELLHEYDGLILGGSGEFYFDGDCADDDENKKVSYEFLEKLKPLFNYIFKHDVPTLGICYGHQIIGAFAGVSIVCDHSQKKSKSHEVTVLPTAYNLPLFVDLPHTFFAHYGHKDSLKEVPHDATLLMDGGTACRVSALRYKNNIYTTQFHPELRFEDVVERVKNSPGYLPEGVTVEEVFKDDKNSNKILQNFGTWILQLDK